jgi:beta-xylosidase
MPARYPNPLIPGFNPDPSCVLVDGVYYLITSTFEYLPAIPVYRSVDFVDWQHVGDVTIDPESAGILTGRSGMGVWAPTIRHHDGVFYVIVSVAASDRGCVVFTARPPTSPGPGVRERRSRASTASIPTSPGTTTAPPTSPIPPCA